MQTLGPAISFGLITASILALAAVGFTVQFGVTNVLNLAYAEVMGASGFIAFVVNRLGLSIWLCLIVAALFGAVASYLLNRFMLMPFIRRGTRLFGMVIVTLAIGLIVQNVVLAVVGPTFGSYQLAQDITLRPGPFVLTTSQLAIMGIAVAAMAFIHVLLRYTQLGTAMRATAADASLARSCGIHTARVIDIAWLLSGALCGMAGVALFINTSAFTASTANSFLVVIVAAAVLGGVGQPYGAMLGALVIGLTTEIAAAFYNPQYKNVIALAILVIVLMVRPQGILAEIANQKEVAT